VSAIFDDFDEAECPMYKWLYDNHVPYFASVGSFLNTTCVTKIDDVELHYACITSADFLNSANQCYRQRRGAAENCDSESALTECIVGGMDAISQCEEGSKELISALLPEWLRIKPLLPCHDTE